MKETKDIVAAYEAAKQAGLHTALATVVLVEGSAYRRAGARMLITEEGQLTGAISGGCLEGDALRKARLAMSRQEPMLLTYDTMDDDDAQLGVGLGCNGIIHILIEPVTEQPNHPIHHLKRILDSRKGGVMVTLFSTADRQAAQPGTCLSLVGEELMMNGLEEISFRHTLFQDARRVLENQRSETQIYTDKHVYTAFVEYLRPQLSLVIIGAGNDAIPLSNIAAVLGWNITVVDGRPNYVLPERFTQATRLLHSRAADLPAKLLEHHGQAAFVLMMHNYIYELEALKALLPLNPAYMGVLGPKKKLERMLAELEDEGLRLSESQLNRLYGPVGLDIGSEGAEEIALSIVAEIKAVFSSRTGHSLKYKPVPIHAEQMKIVHHP